MTHSFPRTTGLPPLTSATVVYRERDISALMHVAESVSDFLDFGHPRFWSVVGASSLGSVRLLQRLAVRAEPESDRHYRAFLFRNALVDAVVSDSLPTLQWLCVNYCPWGFASLAMDKADTRCADLAAQNCHLEMLQWLDTQPASGGCTENSMSAAALHGDFEVVRWLHERGAGSISALRSAIRGGHLEIVQFLFERGNDSHHVISDDSMNDAAHSGNLDLVKWLREVTGTGYTKRAMDCAAGNGDLAMWLHANRPEGCTLDSMDSAAGAGHLDVLQWLHQHRPEGCSAAAIDRAASNGHLGVVQWLFATRNDGCTQAAIKGAIQHGHLHAVEWLHAHCAALADPETLFWCRLRVGDAGDLAAEGGHLDVIQRLHAYRFECFSEDAMVRAARGNHLPVLQWLHHVRAGCSPKVSRSIRNFGDHAELWLWLCEHHRASVVVYDIHWRFYERDDLRAFLKQLGL
ncbi:hypothetical protein PybrP1_002446 [[Pythium] brassicae (nom. inval.)]|nr:hypothetical protein PybrP1_002446 [[Pythium] brassicae (nom. inval.)]